MANHPLKVTHLDSPLRRSDGESAGETLEVADSPRPGEADESSSLSAVVTSPTVAPTSKRRSRSRRRGAAETPAAAVPRSEQAWPPVQGFWEPPALNERVELVSTRLPVSLSRALDRHTRALRDRHDLASQKALPMQEVLAAVVWALGDPEDEAAVDRLDAVYRGYRARRMAAAARALEPS